MSLVVLADVKAHLGVGGAAAPTNVVDDAALQALIESSTRIIEDLAGPVLIRDVVEVHDGEDDEIFLRRVPVVSVTTVTEYHGTGSTIVAPSSTASRVTGYQLEIETGRLIRVASGGYPTRWAFGYRNIEVAYKAGRVATTPEVPGNIKHATLELIAHWWRLRRGGSNTFMGKDGAFVAGGGSGFGVPNRVKHILGPDLRSPVFG